MQLICGVQEHICGVMHINKNLSLSLSPSPARSYTVSEIITIAIVAVVLVVAVVGGVIGCAVRARSYRSAEGLEPLLGEQFRRYSEDERHASQSVV